MQTMRILQIREVPTMPGYGIRRNTAVRRNLDKILLRTSRPCASHSRHNVSGRGRLGKHTYSDSYDYG